MSSQDRSLPTLPYLDDAPTGDSEMRRTVVDVLRNLGVLRHGDHLQDLDERLRWFEASKEWGKPAPGRLVLRHEGVPREFADVADCGRALESETDSFERLRLVMGLKRTLLRRAARVAEETGKRDQCLELRSAPRRRTRDHSRSVPGGRTLASSREPRRPDPTTGDPTRASTIAEPTGGRPLVYLETTAVAAATVGLPEERSAVEAVTTGKETTTSGYVRQEFRSTFLKAAVDAHALLTDSATLGEALKRIGKGFSFRGVVRQAEWLGEVVDYCVAAKEEGETEAETLAKARRWLEGLIEENLMDRFDELVPPQHLLDDTECKRASAEPELDPESGTFSFSPKCSKAYHPPCRIGEFMSDHRGDLATLASLSKGVDAADRSEEYTLHSSATQALAAPHECGGKLCWVGLADAIIAMECPDDAKLCTTDKHFAPLCQWLGRQRIDVRPATPTEAAE